MKIATLFFIFSTLFSVYSIPCYAEDLSEQQAYEIGVSSYLYFYPLITMDLTRRQMTQGDAGKTAGFGPMNSFANMSEYPTANMKTVVRPNFDTLYSSAWLDLTQGPVIISVPDTAGRYYLLPLLDMWTDVFASLGWRTTGTLAGEFAIVPPGWKGELPPQVEPILAPTPYVWVIGRVKTDGPKDYEAVHKIQAGLKIIPLTKTYSSTSEAQNNVPIDLKKSPKEQVDQMPAHQFFAYAAELLKLHPPHLTDQPMLALLKKVGFTQGKSFDLEKLPTAVKQGFEKAPKAAQELMQWKIPTLARVENGWSMNTNTMGVYGNYYLKRAIVANLGLGANLPEDAIYPLNLTDQNGHALQGQNQYTLHFEKDNLPPVNAFWSITLYDKEGYQVANPINRFALSSWMPFQYNQDGSLDLYFSHQSPGKMKEANWLPAPTGLFNLTMRLYAPKNAALVGKWNPPFVKKQESSHQE